MDESGITIRPPEQRDWPGIFELATTAVEHVTEAPAQNDWLRHRMAFPGRQTHFVAERYGKVVGYGAVERADEEPQATCRLFVVTAWRKGLEVAEELYAAALAELQKVGAQRAWLREYAGDELLIGFAQEKGFDVVQEYELDGMKLVTLAKDLRNSALAV